jgi:Domain of unknown function (DUF4157)
MVVRRFVRKMEGLPPRRTESTPARRENRVADFALQDALGNRAVTKLIKSRMLSRAGDPDELQADEVAHPTASSRRFTRSTSAPEISSSASSWAGGVALPEALRREFEPWFGVDLSGVRLHFDGAAAAGARLLNAHAYTLGPDIAFSADAPRPDTAEGHGLIRHELAHVVQSAHGDEPARIRRFESYEHQDIGDLVGLHDFLATPAGRTWAKSLGLDADDLITQLGRSENLPGHVVNYPLGQGGTSKPSKNLPLSAGDITALSGDFYVDPDAMVAAPRSELTKLVEIMRQQHAHLLSNALADVEYERASGGRYSYIASHNATHFAGANVAEWREIHHDALKLAAAARQAGSAGPDLTYQRALFTEAAGAHYLTDAFSSGHLFNKAEVEKEVALQLNAGRYVTPGMYPSWMNVNPGYFPLANYALPWLAGDRHLLVQLVVKNIHDRLGHEGFDVTTKKMVNGEPLRFHGYGDALLNRSDVQLHAVQMAVFTSRSQVERVRDGTLALPTDAAGWDKLDAEVLDWLPNEATIKAATALAISYIPDAIASIPALSTANIGFLQTKMPPVVAKFVAAPLTRPLLEPLDPPPMPPSAVNALNMYNQYKLRFNLP